MKFVSDALIRAAKNGSDPLLYVDVIVDQVEPETLESIIADLKKDDWFDKLAGLEPRAKGHKEWFTKLRDKMLEEYRAAATSEADDDGEAETDD